MNADDIIITPEDIASLTYKFKENIYFMAIFDFSKYNSKMLKEAVFHNDLVQIDNVDIEEDFRMYQR